MSISRLCFVVILSSSAFPGETPAWVYPEHRDIAVQAEDQLDAGRKAIFDSLWSSARIGQEKRLCEAGIDRDQSLAPECIDWAALTAIAGDHSCSSRQMLETVTGSDWILTVADVAAQLKTDLSRIPVGTRPQNVIHGSELLDEARERLTSEANRAERVNALRVADTRMMRADPEYATRAAANNAHFLLARASSEQSRLEYADAALQPGSEINAIGVYAWFHLSALQKAGRLASEQLSEVERRDLSRSALFDEAFALHFLQDAFASGHVAGTWGTAAQRKGTHDYYNENGLETFTWGGSEKSLVLMGDAHMRPQDADVAARAVRRSLRQVLDVAAGNSDYPLPHRPSASEAPDAFNVCENNIFPEREQGTQPRGEYRSAFEETLRPTPVPRLGPGLGEMPRFHSELGPFIGLAGALDGRLVDGGFESSQNTSGWVTGLDVSLRAGLGLEGALGEAADGLVFGSVGYRIDAASNTRYSSKIFGDTGGDLSAAIPGRTGLSLRFRMPFYLVPADLLLLSPMYLINPDAYVKMAVTAANGGLIPWQSGFATSIGRFQFVLGRELGITFYGLDGNDQLLVPGVEQGGFGRVVNFKSTSWELPILEYRPYRSFSSNQSSSVIFQLYGGADVPRGAEVVLPAGAPPVDLGTIWFLGIRMMFDWRSYFDR